MITTINGKIRLSDLARRLDVSNQNLRNHMKNDSGLGIDAIKLGNKLTDDWLIPIDSVLTYLEWSMSHSKKLKFGTISEVMKEVKELK